MTKPEREPLSFREKNNHFKALDPQERRALMEMDQNEQKREQNLNTFQRDHLRDETGETYKGKLGRVSDRTDDPAEEARSKRLFDKLEHIVSEQQAHFAEDLERDKARVKEDLKKSGKRSRSDSYQNSRVVPQTNSGDGKSDPFDQADKENSDPSNHRDKRQKIGDDDQSYDQGLDDYSRTLATFEKISPTSGKADKISPTSRKAKGNFDVSHGQGPEALNRRLNGREMQNHRLNGQKREELTEVLRRTVQAFNTTDIKNLPKEFEELLEHVNGKPLSIDRYNTAVEELEGKLREKEVERMIASMQEVNQKLFRQTDKKQEKVDEGQPNHLDNKGQKAGERRPLGDVSNEQPFNKVDQEQQKTLNVNTMLEEAAKRPEKKQKKS